MDKQSNVLFNTRIQELHQDSGNEMRSSAARTMPIDRTASIPVNTRTIGAPEGIYILYLEDYVHTFIKKNCLKQKKMWRMTYEKVMSTKLKQMYHPTLQCMETFWKKAAGIGL